MNTFWEITKRQLDEKKAELRNKDREMEDAEERHQIEIKVPARITSLRSQIYQSGCNFSVFTRCASWLFLSVVDRNVEMTEKNSVISVSMSENVG